MLIPCSHIASVTVTANQRSNLIFRCFVSRDVNLLVRALLPTFGRSWNIAQLFGRPTLKEILNASREFRGDLLNDSRV